MSKERLVERATKEIFYIGESDLIKLGSPFSSASTQTVALTSSDRVYVTINFDMFHKYTSIKSIKLKLKSTLSSNVSLKMYHHYGEYMDGSYEMETTNGGSEGVYELNLLSLLCTDNYLHMSGTVYYGFQFTQSVTLYTKNAATSYKPQLIIEYIDDCESIINQKMIDGSAGRALNYSINARSGRPTFVKSLLSINTTVLPINLGLYFEPLKYNESLSYLPKGWKFNYDQKVIQNDEGYEYIDGCGLVHQFKSSYNMSSVYYDISGNGLVMIKSGATIRIEDGYNNNLYFNENLGGYLYLITNQIGGNSFGILLNRDSSTFRLTSIYEYNTINGLLSQSSKITFAYTTSKVTISATGYPSVILNKDSNNRLSTISEEDGRISTYTYGSDGMLTAALSDNGEKTLFTYDSRNRVKSITNSITSEANTLSKLTFTYKCLATSIINNFGVITGYNFNEEGEFLASYEIDGEEYRNYNSVVKNDEGIIKSLNNKDVYLGYKMSPMQSNIMPLQLSADSSLSKGVLSLNTTSIYKLSFVYRFSGLSILELLNEHSKIIVKQGDITLLTVKLNFYTRYDTLLNYDFMCVSSTEPIKLIVMNNFTDLTLHLDNIKIFKANTLETYYYTNCNMGVESKVDINGIMYYKYLNKIFKYNTSNTAPGKMYFEDLVENVKNAKQKSEGYHVWYNKKRGLIAETSKVKLIGISSEIDLSNMVVGVYNNQPSTGKLQFTRYDYSNDTSVTNHLSTSSTYLKYGGTTYTLEKNIINKDFQTVKKYDYITSNKTLEYQYIYDIYGNVLSVKTLNSGDSKYYLNTYTYDKKLLLTETSLVNGGNSTITYTYDSIGNLKTVKYPDGNVVDYAYFSNTAGKLQNVSQTVSGVTNKNDISYTKDLVNKYVGNSKGMSFEYDSYNMVKKYKNSNNTIWTANRTINIDNNNPNENGLIEEVLYGFLGGYSIRNTYDKYGNLVLKEEKTESSYYTIMKAYYSDLKTDDVVYSDPLDSNLCKNSQSKVKRIYDGVIGNNEYYYYNDAGELTQIKNTRTSNRPERIWIDKDEQKRVIRKIYALSTAGLIENFTYKNTYSSELSTINYNMVPVDGSSWVVDLTYTFTKDNLGRLKADEINTSGSNKLSREYSYNDSGDNCSSLVSALKLYKGTTLIDTYKYTYDSMGRIIMIRNSNNSVIASYVYDGFGRLVRENNNVLNKTSLFTYDINGNITSKKVSPYSLFDSTNPSTYAYGYDPSRDDVLSSYNGQSITTSEIGNITKIGTTEYKWNRGTRLSSVYKSSYDYVNMEYDVNGIRIKKTQGYNGTTITHTYLSDGSRILSETISGGSYAGTLNYIYIGNEIVGFVYKNVKYYFLKNIQGDIIKIYDESNNFVASYSYDAWGNHKVYNASGIEATLPEHIGNVNPFRYRGYYYDRETNLYYCNSRYYNPELCRWMSMDSINYAEPKSVNGLNSYAYCMNNPVNMYRIKSAGSFSTKIATSSFGIGDSTYIGTDGAMNLSQIPKWVYWALSGSAVICGIILCALGAGAVGGPLIAAGAGSIIGGYVNEANGGSFAAGYLGGAVTGVLCAIGAGYAATSFIAASNAVTSLGVITNLALGVSYSFVGGMTGNYIGASITNMIDGNNIEPISLLHDSVLLGALNIISGIGGCVSESFLNSVTYDLLVSASLGKSIGVFFTLTTETIYDTVSAFFAWLLSNY